MFRYLHQVGWGAAFRLGAMVAGFLAVPWLIAFLGKDGYGIWASLLAMASWIVVFDGGITSGLRNRVTEALARGRLDEARQFTATAYVFLLGICALAFLLFVGGIQVFGVVAGAPAGDAFRASLMVLGAGMVIAFYFSLVHQLFYAIHKSFYVSLYSFLVSLFFLGGLVVVVTWQGHGPLLTVAWLYAIIAVCVGVLLNLVFFAARPELLPRVADASLRRLRDISGFGLQFFLIQMSGLVMFTSDRMMVASFLGASQAAEYDIALKYMSVVTLLQMVLIAPVWAFVSHHYALGDVAAIRQIGRRQIRIWLGLSAVAVAMGLAYPLVIGTWLGKGYIDRGVVAVGVVYSIEVMWLTVFSNIINGTGKIRIAAMTSVGGAIACVPLAYLLAVPAGLGAKGVLAGIVLALLPGVVVAPWQLRLILRREDTGLWSK